MSKNRTTKGRIRPDSEKANIKAALANPEVKAKMVAAHARRKSLAALLLAGPQSTVPIPTTPLVK